MLYGNSNISSSQENISAVWDNNYKAVYHMSEDPAGTAPQILDSTINSADGSSVGTMTSGDIALGKIGNAVDFDGADDYIDMGNPFSLSTGGITICSWIKMNTPQAAAYSQIVAKSTGGSVFWDFYTIGTGSLGMSIVVDAYKEIWPPIGTTNFRYVCGVYNGAANVNLYIDGTDLGGSTNPWSGSRSADTGTNLTIGSPNWYFKGIIDEVRILDTVRSTNWIATEYNNQNSPATFYSIGAEL